MEWSPPEIKEINLICMSGQGSVQTVEIMAQAYYEEYERHIGSVVYPGARSKSTPVVCYLKVSDQPIASTSTNFDPTEVIVFWDGLLRVAANNAHEAIVDAIARQCSGVLLVNTSRSPEEIDLPFEFHGTVATVDATAIARRHLQRNPPPVGITLLGAYAAVTGALEMDTLMRLVRARFGKAVAEANVAAAQEACERVRILRDVRRSGQSDGWQPARVTPEELPEWYPFDRTPLRGFQEGSPFIWRDAIPVCDDGKCHCKQACISEVLCPDNTGFIVRDGIAGADQGYRIDVDYCRGCGICVEVCVHGALRMLPEEEALRSYPAYQGISVAPYRSSGRN